MTHQYPQETTKTTLPPTQDESIGSASNSSYQGCNENQFKCLIFVCGLQSSEDAFIRLKFPGKIESDPNCTIQILAEKCKLLLNLRHDTKMIENGSPAVHSVKQFLHFRQGQQKVNFKTDAQATHPEVPPRLPPSACCFCGETHFTKDCPYRHHKCSRCRTTGYKEGYCNSSKPRFKRQRLSRPNVARQDRRCDRTQSPLSQVSTATSNDATPQLKWTINPSTSRSIVHRT
ncbi:hypothetical protein ANCCAN_24098 [Ancylostoma caninum]|uniref:Zinc knuckle n=1 Tax=Ancylostoma caninum TaxID=29170 RepID=A0A368FH49_ANCCA|nr:hypothetical protein ANCCAN_24098 [Ancylostoma caninum]